MTFSAAGSWFAIPKPWLYAGILVFATMGTIAAKPSVVELTMLSTLGTDHDGPPLADLAICADALKLLRYLSEAEPKHRMLEQALWTAALVRYFRCFFGGPTRLCACRT